MSRLFLNPSLALIVVFLIAPLTASGADTKVFGVELRFPASESSPPEAPNTTSRDLVSLREAQDRLATLQAEKGPYHPDLSHMLLAEAERARSVGQSRQALEWYDWALHNIRVNNGLGDPAQLPVLEEIMALQRQMGDREALSGRIEYFYRIMGSGRRPYSPTRLEASLAYLRWHQELLMVESWQGESRRVLQLYEGGKLLQERVCTSEKWSREFCEAFTLAHLGTLYLIEHHLITDSVIDGPAEGINQPFVSPDMQPNPSEQRLNQLAKTAYSAGARLLKTNIKYVENKTTLELALADWYWFQGRRGQALDIYDRLRKGQPPMFSDPVPLPALPTLDRDPQLSERIQTVSAVFTVTDGGRVTDLDVELVDNEADASVIWVARSLRRLRFRPAFNDQGRIDQKVQLTLQAMR
ncbi:hypothetical protein [Luminiphilus syltensis]|nr:hypothetical protein [Luminiphilus syltensis]